MSPTLQINPPKMGIYRIVCLADGRVYVGQSRRIKNRWYDHQKELRAGRGSPKLQMAWVQYGPDKFSFEVLEEVTNPDDLESREQHYMDTLQSAVSGLNTLPRAGSFREYTPDENARRKIGLAASNRPPEVLLKMRQAKLGKRRGPPSQETRQKISAAQKGKTRGPMSVENREAISQAKRGVAPIAAIEANRGKHRTDEVKQKVSAAKKGKPFPEAQRQKMLGKKPGRK